MRLKASAQQSPQRAPIELASSANAIVFVGCPATERGETEQTLARASVSVVWADSASAVRQLPRRDVPVLFDFSHGPAALQAARDLRDLNTSRPMFAAVDPDRPDQAVEAVLEGLADVLVRPLTGRRVANAIEREHRLAEGLDAAGPGAAGAEELYGCSAAMREVVAQVDQAGATRAGVTLRGESGSGRHVVARAIHACGGAGTFRAVDCAALDGDQLDAALFGAVSARTNGDESHGLERVGPSGLVCQANGGTLYLRHLSEASARVQARLARILRDREAVVADTGETMALDIRPVAAAGPESGEAPDGRLREDLLRRLSAICIDVPPLRKRREDIPALANRFVRQLSARRGVPPPLLSRPALSLICALPWRQNAAELWRLVEAILAGLSGAGRRGIGIDEVLAHLRLDGDAVAFAYSGTLRQARHRFEREYIAAVLNQHRGRIAEAAKVLGIQRTNLYRKLRVLHVGRGKGDKSLQGL